MDLDTTADRIAEAIKRDVTGRRGWRQEYDQFDPDVCAEIDKKWRILIRRELEAAVIAAKLKVTP